MLSDISLINEFEFSGKMTEDHCSETIKSKHKSSNLIYAIKRCPQESFISSEREIDFQREKAILFDISKKNYPTIPKLYNSFEDASYRYLLMDYYEGINLENYLLSQTGNIEDNIIIHILKEMLKTLSFLHNDCHIMHRNIKPNTIIIDKNNNIKLIGFHYAA